MRVLVTGGAGFIGSHIVDQLVATDHDVIVVDCLHPAAHRGLPDNLDPRVEYHWNDVKDLDSVTDSRAAPTPCATKPRWSASVSTSPTSPTTSPRTTSEPQPCYAALHDLALAGRLVLASSMVVYGEGMSRCAEHGVVRPPPRAAEALDRGQFEPTCPQCGHALVPVSVPEDAPLDPRNVYAATKLHQEHLCNAFAREHADVTVTALRYHNVYGPRMPRNTPYAGVASLFRSALERGESPQVYEDGGQLRDFIHVRDIARANLLALTKEGAPGAVFNVATGMPRTVLDMAEALAHAFGPATRRNRWSLAPGGQATSGTSLPAPIAWPNTSASEPRSVFPTGCRSSRPPC